MIRPSSLVFLPIFIAISLYQIKKKKVIAPKLLLIATVLLVIFIPQLYNNVVYYDDFTPLIHADLYTKQSHLATTFLKYGTVVIHNEHPRLPYFSNLPEITDTSSQLTGIIQNNNPLVMGASLQGTNVIGPSSIYDIKIENSELDNNSIKQMFDSEISAGVTSFDLNDVRILHFDGTNYYTKTDLVFDFERTDAFSISYWIKTDSGTGWIVTNSNSSKNNGIIHYFRLNGNPSLFIKDTNGLSIEKQLNTKVNDGDWHHVVVTYDGSSNVNGINWYLDGIHITSTTNFPSSTKSVSIFELLGLDPLSFLYVYSAHIFGVLDWGYVDTYIDNLYPLERIPASIFLYFSWFVILLGIITYRNKTNTLKNNILFSTLIASTLLYSLFIGTTAVESRFGFIIFLLLLPFSGFGIKFIYNLYSNSTSTISLIKNGFKLYLSLISFILVFFYLSFWMDLQTNRIDWFDKIMNIL